MDHTMSADVLPAAVLVDGYLFLGKAVIRGQKAEICQFHPVAHGRRLPFAEPGKPGAPFLQEPALCCLFGIELFGFPNGKLHRMQCISPLHTSSPSSILLSCTRVLSRWYSANSACVPTSVMA